MTTASPSRNMPRTAAVCSVTVLCNFSEYSSRSAAIIAAATCSAVWHNRYMQWFDLRTSEQQAGVAAPLDAQACGRIHRPRRALYDARPLRRRHAVHVHMTSSGHQQVGAPAAGNASSDHHHHQLALSSIDGLAHEWHQPVAVAAHAARHSEAVACSGPGRPMQIRDSGDCRICQYDAHLGARQSTQSGKLSSARQASVSRSQILTL